MNDTPHSWAQKFAEDAVDALSELDGSAGSVDTLRVFETLCREIHEQTIQRWAQVFKNEHMLVTTALAVNMLFVSIQTALFTLFGTSIIRVTRYCFLSPEEEARRSSLNRKHDQLLRAMGSMSDTRLKLAAIEEFGLRKFQDLQEQAWQKMNKKSDQ